MLSFDSPGGFVGTLLFLLGIVLYFLLMERLIAQRTGRGGEDAISGIRRIGVIRVLIKLAPLLGLLGTVCGIISTFQGLSGVSPAQEIANGIYSALYTTQYGLALAIPAYLLEKYLREDYGRDPAEGGKA